MLLFTYFCNEGREGVVASTLGGTARMPKLAVSAVSASPILATEGFLGCGAAGELSTSKLSFLGRATPSGPHLSTLNNIVRI